MDGFYLAFVAVGTGLFWQSTRERRPESAAALMTGWFALGGSMASAILLFSTKWSGAERTEHMPPAVAFEAVRHVLLGVATVCVGLAVTNRTTSRLPPIKADADALAKALQDVDTPPRSDA
jgi:uncharacterized membrane protein